MNEQNLRGPVVVIGAGILGCSAAWHLLRSGVRELTLVDAGGVGSGTSSAGAGFVALWAAGFFPAFGTPELEMEHYSLAFYRGLHEAGAQIGYRNNGNLLLVPSEQSLVGKHDSERARAMVQHPDAPAGSRELSSAEVASLTGVVAADQVQGGAWQPAGIQVEAGAAVSVLAEAVRAMGGTILEGTPVIGLQAHGNELDAVLTPSRVLPARAVVLAAGAWTNGLLGHLGIALPLARVVATRLVTAPTGVPPTMPTIQGAGGWLRECRAGYTWGSGTAYRPAFDSRPTDTRFRSDGRASASCSSTTGLSSRSGPRYSATWRSRRSPSGCKGCPATRPINACISGVPHRRRTWS